MFKVLLSLLTDVKKKLIGSSEMQLCFQTFKSPIPRSRIDLASLVLFDDDNLMMLMMLMMMIMMMTMFILRIKTQANTE